MWYESIKNSLSDEFIYINKIEHSQVKHTVNKEINNPSYINTLSDCLSLCLVLLPNRVYTLAIEPVQGTMAQTH